MKKTISIFLALLILTSSSNLTFAIHHCQSGLSEFALLFGGMEMDCGMMEEDVNECTSHTHSEEEPQDEDDCCDDTTVQITIEDDFNSSITEFKFNSKAQNNFLVAFTATFVAPYLSIFSLGVNPKHKYKYYSPPLLEQDKQVLLQTFLI